MYRKRRISDLEISVQLKGNAIIPKYFGYVSQNKNVFLRMTI